MDFWRKYLDHAQMAQINGPSQTPPDTQGPEVMVKMITDMPLPTMPQGTTMASLLKAAWSLALLQTSQSKDIVYRQVVSGRDTPLQVVDVVSGSCITFFPFRVSL
ncbi:uncharacterized protein BDW43DRAFT_316147 [Aspergillus alliaceus]|uniref:uncharacterized protein n=1 Tax=Petromyces alliaceus TaxID=209559 RepID=UPI0012A600E5|nr:uncharacterized protein BDW43DRAFT_316147 [Aspergillus alliaceus]KAB8228169.1 hypothetical protein BDW43DRAFT_316147 [Aspergillus alliaceus]